MIAVLEDLTGDDTDRQYIAFLTLQEVIGDRNPGFVAAIEEAITRGEIGVPDIIEDEAASAFVEDASREEVLDALSSAVLARIQVGDVNFFSPADVTQQAQIEPPAVAELVDGEVVYIQFRSEDDHTRVAAFREELELAELTAPGIQQVDGSYENEVRFFHDSDATAAAELVVWATRAFGGKFELVHLVGKFSAPEGQLEVWIAVLR